MNHFDQLARQSRDRLVAEAGRIADTDTAFEEFRGGIRPVSARSSFQPSRRPSPAAALAIGLVAASIAVGVVVARQDAPKAITAAVVTEPPGTNVTETVPTVAVTTMPDPQPTVATVTTILPVSLDPSTAVVPASSWDQLDLGPLSPRWNPAVVATSSEVLVIGGHVTSRDAVAGDYLQRVGEGAAYNPATATWRSLADPGGVFALTTMALWKSCTCDTDSQITLVGPNFSATYDVFTGETVQFDVPLAASVPEQLSPDGEAFAQFVEVPGSITVSRLVAGSNAWQILPPAPLNYVRTMLRVGGKTVIVGSIEGDPAGAAAMLLDETSDPGQPTWVDLNMASRNWNDLFATTDGQRLMIWAGYGQFPTDLGAGVWLNPAEGIWHDLPPIDEQWWECWARGLAVPGGVLIDNCGSIVHYRSAENDLVTQSAPPLGAVPMVMLGDRVYRWGEPTRYAEGPDAPTSMQFGSLTLSPT